MLCLLGAMALSFVAIISAEESVPIERFVEVRIEPWNNTTPSIITYGIGGVNPMIVNYANTEETTRPITRFTLKVWKGAISPGLPPLYTLSSGKAREYLGFSEHKLCMGGMFTQTPRDGASYYELRCSGTTESRWYHEATHCWTVQGTEGNFNQGMLNLRGGDWDTHESPDPVKSAKWNPAMNALNACAQPDWQKVVAQGSGATLSYYEDDCEAHDQVKVKTVYRVIV